MFLDKDYAALMEIGEIIRTRRRCLKYALVSCRDGKFVSHYSRGVFVTAVSVRDHIYAHTCACVAGRLKVQTSKFIATKHDTRLGTCSQNCARFP